MGDQKQSSSWCQNWGCRGVRGARSGEEPRPAGSAAQRGSIRVAAATTKPLIMSTGSDISGPVPPACRYAVGCLECAPAPEASLARVPIPGGRGGRKALTLTACLLRVGSTGDPVLRAVLHQGDRSAGPEPLPGFPLWARKKELNPRSAETAGKAATPVCKTTPVIHSGHLPKALCSEISG